MVAEHFSADQAERHDEIAEYMLRVGEQPAELLIEERSLLSIADKNAVGIRRAARHVIISVEPKNKTETIKEQASKLDGGCAAQAPMIQKVLKTVEFPQVQYVDEIVDEPVAMRGQVQEEIVEVIRVVDSEDLPLGISGETLLRNKILRVIKKNYVTKYLETLEKIAELNVAYQKFHEQFGACLKLGISEDSTVGVKTAELLRFGTFKSGDEQINFEGYADRKKEGQNDVYCITSESNAMVLSSPFLENLRNKGYEVPYMAEPVDEYAVHQPEEFAGKMLKSTTEEEMDLGDDDEKKTLEELITEFEPLAELTEGVLGDKGEKVIVSDRIVDSLCVLTTSEYGWSAKMERIMKAQALRDNSMTSHMVSKKTMEVNPAAWEQQHKSSKQQPRTARQSTRQEREKERGRREREKKGREERESVKKCQRGIGQEGRKKEEEKEDEEGRGEQVEEDVTGWTEVTRKKRRKMIQIFVRVNGSKTSPMEVSLTDDRVEDVMRQIQKDEDVYVTMHGKVLRRDEKLKSCEVTDGCTVEVTSRMRGGGKHKDKKGKEEKKKQVAQLDDGMCAMACEQMRQVMETLRTLADNSTGEDKRRVAENVEDLRKAIIGLRKQARGEELQRVAELEESLKKLEEEMILWSVEEQEQRRQEEQEHAVLRKGKGKGNGGKGDKGGRGHEGTRKLRWADCEEEEEGARQGAAEGEWHKARKEQGIIWLDGSYEDQEGHEGSAGGERCEVCGQLEVWSEESEEQEERGGQGGEGVRQKMPSEEDEEDERTVVAPNTGAGGSHPRATTDPEEEVKEEEVTGEEMADEKPPGLEVVKSEQDEHEEEERSQVKSEREVQEEEQEEVKSEQEVPEDEERKKQEAREARAHEAQEERRAHEARGEEKRRALEAREEEKRAQEAREEEKRAQEAREEEKRAQEAREEEKRAQEAREEEKKESAGGARGAEESAGGARGAEESAGGARGGEESAGGA